MLPKESVCIKCRLCMDLCETYKCVIMHFVSSLNDLCLHILSFVSCTNFITFWNQYTDSIVKNPCICACLVLCLIICQVSYHSELSVTFWQCIVWSSPVYHFCGKDFCISYANHLTFWQYSLLYNGQKNDIKNQT